MAKACLLGSLWAWPTGRLRRVYGEPPPGRPRAIPAQVFPVLPRDSGPVGSLETQVFFLGPRSLCRGSHSAHRHPQSSADRSRADPIHLPQRMWLMSVSFVPGPWGGGSLRDLSEGSLPSSLAPCSSPIVTLPASPFQL